MSNSVRSLGSGRNADAVARHDTGQQTDPGGTDAEFATVMNLVIGATDGAAAGNGKGAFADGGAAGQGNHRHGQLGMQSGQTGDVSNDDPETMPAPNPSDLKSTSTLNRVAGSLVHVEPSLQGVAFFSTDAAGKSLSSSLTANADPSTAADAAPTGAGLVDAATTDEPPFLVQTAVAPKPTSRRSDTIGFEGLSTITGNASTTPSIGAFFSADGGSAAVVSLSAQRRQHGMHSAGASSVPTSGSSNDNVAASNGGAAGLLLSGGAILTAASPASGSFTETSKAVSPRQLSFVAGLGSGDSPVASSPAPSAAKHGATLLANQASSSGWRVRPDGVVTPTTELAVDQAEPSATAANPVDTPSDIGPVAVARRQDAVSGTADKIVPEANLVDQSQGNAGSVSIELSPIPTNSPDGSNNVPSGPLAVAPARMTPPAIAILDVAASGGAIDPRPAAQATVVTAIGPATGAASAIPTATATASLADAGAGVSTGASSSFGEAMANHVLSMISAGHQEATLQLQPPQLGELTVRVAVQGRDVSTWFGTAQPQVQVAVSQALDQLRTDLAGAGLNLAGTWVGADASAMRRETFAAATPPRRASFAPSIDSSSSDGNDVTVRSSGVSVYV